MQRGLNYNSTPLTIVVILMLATHFIANIGGVVGLFSPSEVINPTPLHSLILSFEVLYPKWSILISALLIVMGSISAMRLSLSVNIFGKASHLVGLVYLTILLNFVSKDDLLTPLIVANIGNSIITNLYHISTKGGALYRLFTSVFWVGMLPLFYPSMLQFLLIVFAIVIIFDCDLREIIIVAMGLMMPILGASYIAWWGSGVPFAEPFTQLITSFSAPAVVPPWRVGWLSIVAIVVLMSLYAIFNLNNFSIPEVSRRRILFAAIMVILATTLILIPTFTTTALMVFVMPSSIILTISIFNLRTRWSRALLLIVTLLTLVSPFLP